MCFFWRLAGIYFKKMHKEWLLNVFVEHIALILAAVLAGTVTGIIAKRR